MCNKSCGNKKFYSCKSCKSDRCDCKCCGNYFNCGLKDYCERVGGYNVKYPANGTKAQYLNRYSLCVDCKKY